MIPTRRTGLAFEDFDGECVVYDPDARVMHHLNASAAAVFRACDGTRTIDDVVDFTATEFAADPECNRREFAVV